MVSYEEAVFRVLHNADKTLLLDENYTVCLDEKHRMADQQFIRNAILASGTEVKLVSATVLSENVCILKKNTQKTGKGERVTGLCVCSSFSLRSFDFIQFSKHPSLVIPHYARRGGRKAQRMSYVPGLRQAGYLGSNALGKQDQKGQWATDKGLLIPFCSA